MKKKKDGSPNKDTVFSTFTKLMGVCDDVIDEVVDDDIAEISDMSSQVVNIMMAVEFAYICYRNRLKVFLEGINEAAGVEVFDDEDLKEAVESARKDLHPLLKSVIVTDKKMFKRSLEVFSLDDEDPEQRINSPRGDA